VHTCLVEIQQLRCFLAVAEELHFGRAAERLRMTASPVSRMIKDLERELGTELFVRAYHQIELTPAGRELAVHVPPLLAALDRLPGEIQRVAAGETRPMLLGGSHLSPPRILDTIVDCAEKSVLDRRVDVTLGPSAELLPAVLRGELDAAVVHLPLGDPRVDVLPLASYRFLVAMRRDDALASHESLTIGDIADRTLVTFPLALQPVAMQRLRDELLGRGMHRFRLLAGADSAMLAGHVRRTGDLTFTLAPETGGPARVFDDPAFVVIPLLDGPSFVLGLAWLADRADDPVISGLLDELRQRWPDGGIEV
jgi:DNA-binding transcriptional LysR family regulator